MAVSWISGKEVHEENDAHTEYRPLSEIQNLTLHNIVKPINSFLNARLKGRIILGIYGFPVKLVRGFPLDGKQKAQVSQRVSEALHHRFSPSVPEELVKVKFEPVYQEQLVEEKNVPVLIEGCFVVEIHMGVVKDPTAFFKVLDDGRYHYREGSRILPLTNVCEVIGFRDREDRKEMERKLGIYSSEPSPHLDTSSTTTNLPFDKFGSKRLGRSKIHNAKIDTMRAYVQGNPCKVTSDTTHEIRPEDNVDQTSDSAMANVLNAFLNSGLGGRIYYGFSPDGPNRAFVVRGLLLPRDKRDQFRLGVDDVINRFRPRPHHARIAVDYVPVLTRDKRTVPDLFMVEVSVEKQSSVVYFTADFRIYTRNGPNNVQVHVQQIRDMVIQERMASWNAEVSGLRGEADDDGNNNQPIVETCDVDRLLLIGDEEMMEASEEQEILLPGNADRSNGLTETRGEAAAEEEATVAEEGRVDADRGGSKNGIERMLEQLKKENEKLRLENLKLKGEKTALADCV